MPVEVIDATQFIAEFEEARSALDRFLKELSEEDRKRVKKLIENLREHFLGHAVSEVIVALGALVADVLLYSLHRWGREAMEGYKMILLAAIVNAFNNVDREVEKRSTESYVR